MTKQLFYGFEIDRTATGDIKIELLVSGDRERKFVVLPEGVNGLSVYSSGAGGVDKDGGIFVTLNGHKTRKL